MGALFSPDSKFMRVMGRTADLMVLNLLFLLTSIPVFTAGAAWTALYAVSFRFGTEREGKLVRSYFRAFGENFRQATALWLIVLILGGSLVFNTCFFYLLPGAVRWCFVLTAGLLVLLMLLAGYLFPLLSQFGNSTLSTFKNALLFSVGYLPRSVLMAVFNLFPFALLLLDLYRFFQMGLLWIALYFAAAAYANCILLKKVFAPYMPQESGEGGE